MKKTVKKILKTLFWVGIPSLIIYMHGYSMALEDVNEIINEFIEN